MGKTGHTIASSGLASFIFELRAVRSRHRVSGDFSIFATAIEVQVQYYCRHRRRQDFAMEDGGISSTGWLLLVMAVSVFLYGGRCKMNVFFACQLYSATAPE